MNLIVVSDIFGKTAGLNQFTDLLSTFYKKVVVVEPHSGQTLHFSDEENAYQYFQQNCGIEKLTDLLGKEVKRSKEMADIIGFSVGGTSAWELSGKDISTRVRQVVCFYSSRIREKIDISPLIPTSLIFPAVEKSFELEPVIQSVGNKQNVEIVRTNYLHGFMNKASKNFSATGYQYFSDWLVKRAVLIN